MNKLNKLIVELCVGAAILLGTTVAQAEIFQDKSTLTVTERLEVPGAILEPGTYVIKVVDSQNNRNIVQITNVEETKVFATALATPHVGAQPQPNTMFVFYNTATGNPKALRTWFAPNDRFGQDLVYPKARATELTAMTHETVPSTTEEVVYKAPVVAPAPARVETKTETVRTETPAPMAEAPARRRLPKTASAYSVWAVLGLLCIAGALSLRAIPRRAN